MNLARRLWLEEDGQGLVEYTLIVVLVALVFWVAIKNTNIGSGLASGWSKVTACVGRRQLRFRILGRKPWSERSSCIIKNGGPTWTAAMVSDRISLNARLGLRPGISLPSGPTPANCCHTCETSQRLSVRHRKGKGPRLKPWPVYDAYNCIAQPHNAGWHCRNLAGFDCRKIQMAAMLKPWRRSVICTLQGFPLPRVRRFPPLRLDSLGNQPKCARRRNGKNLPLPPQYRRISCTGRPSSTNRILS